MFKKIVSLTVPHYVIMSVLTILFANLFINEELPNITLGIGALLLAVAIISFNMFNMTQDIKLDSYKKRDRPLVKGDFDKKQIIKISIILYLLVIGIIVLSESGLGKYWPVLIFVFLSIAYSTRFLYLKKQLFASNVFGMVLYATIPILLVFSTTNKVNYFYLYFFSIIMFFIATTKEFEDYEIEKINNFKSMTTLFGVGKTKKIIIGGINLFLLINLFLSLIRIISQNMILPILLGFILTNTFFRKVLQGPIEENITSQSKLVTHTMSYFIMLQLLFYLHQFFSVAFL